MKLLLTNLQRFLQLALIIGVVEQQQKIICPQSINILEAAWLADIITHHTTIHLRKACVDLGTSIAYLTHLLTARFVGLAIWSIIVVATVVATSYKSILLPVAVGVSNFTWISPLFSDMFI